MFDKNLTKLPGFMRVMALLLVSSLAQAACIAALSLALAHTLANLWNGASLADQGLPIAVFLACFLARHVILYVQGELLDSYARSQARSLRERMLETAFASNSDIVGHEGTAAVAAHAIEGIDQIENYLRIILPKIVGVVAIPIPLLICAFVHDWVTGVILLVAFPVIIFYMVLLGRTAKARAEAQYATYTRMSNHFIDTLRGLDTLKAFGAAKPYGATVFDVSERFREATIRTLRVATLSGAVLDLIATFGVAAVAIMLAFRLMDGSLSLYVGLACLILSPEYFRPIREFAGDFHASFDGKNALIAVLGILDAGDADPTEAPAVANWDKNPVLRLSHVSFSYGQPSRPGSDDGADATPSLALDDISFELRGNRRVGIVGTSGSGKSTLAALLGGFNLPASGSIEACGTQLAHLRVPDWQRQMLFIPQDPYLFSTTLRENIAFYTPQATDEDIDRAVRMVGLESLVSELPQGLDTRVGEGGRGLSGGQAQRVALCRALLDPSRKVLVFDEPTAHLDIETELELKERMLPIMQDRLVLFATHRMHWLQNMDWVLVLENGCLVEQGTPHELLARDGALTRLARQMRGGDAA